MCELAIERAHKYPFIEIVETRSETIYPEPFVGQDVIDVTELLMKRAGSDKHAQGVARPGSSDYVDWPGTGTGTMSGTVPMPDMSSFLSPGVSTHPMPQPGSMPMPQLGSMPFMHGMPVALAMPLPNQGASQLGANPPIGESAALFIFTPILIVTLLTLTLPTLSHPAPSPSPSPCTLTLHLNRHHPSQPHPYRCAVLLHHERHHLSISFSP